MQMFRLSDSRDSLGLTCDHRGLDLAGIPLLSRAGGRFRPRPRHHLTRLLTKAYRTSIDTGSVTKGLQAVADALNDGEIARAMIAAVQLKLPPLDWHGAVRILRTENALAKYDFNPDEPRLPAGQPGGGEWTTGGGSSSEAAESPAPALRYLDGSLPSPRAPLVGGRWPAPTGAISSHLFHPAQAEEDENGRGGLLESFADPLRELRLERYEWLRTALGELEPGNQAVWSLTSPDYFPTQADIDELTAALLDAQERAGDPPATEWTIGWSARGIQLELWRLGGERILPFNAPTIDDLQNRESISVKSIDLNAPWYANPANLSNRIDRYVDQLVRFDGMKWGEFEIEREDIQGKVLDIVVPKGSGTPA
jgi:hypothetical protein